MQRSKERNDNLKNYLHNQSLINHMSSGKITKPVQRLEQNQALQPIEHPQTYCC